MPLKPGSVEINASPIKGESRPRRGYVNPAELTTRPAPGIDTVHDVLRYAIRHHGAKNGFGWRNTVKIIEEEKQVKKMVGGKEITENKVWKYFQLSDYEFISYIEFGKRVDNLAAGLVKHNVPKGGVFNIYASTCLNWQLMQHACAVIGTTIATAYDTLGESGLSHSLSEPECYGVFTHPELVPLLVKVLPNTPTVKLIVYDGELSNDLQDKIKAVRDDITLLHIDNLSKDGEQALPTIKLEERHPKPEDTSCIMYTSGSTGAPKGVVLSHSNLIASVGAVWKLLGHIVESDDTFLAYLPLAHILEYIVELTFVFGGITLGFGKIKTLTDASVRNCVGDIRALKPSIMVGVPAVWETIRKGIVSKVGQMSSLKQSVFNGALTLKKANIPGVSTIIDNVVLSAVKANTGGRLRIAMSGGAALSKETQEFLTLALVTVLQGYGMTESCGMCTILPPEYMSYGPVGVPVPSIEIKLLDVPEAGYTTSGTPQKGEILIRGPSVTKGYFKRPDLNNDETIFTKDGWLRTGDVGQWNTDGTLSVIDRVKNLVKLSGGEYIGLERLESTYRSCNLVMNICVHASSDAKQPMAIILPHESNLRAALKDASIGFKGNPDDDLNTLCHDKAVRELVLKQCNAVGKKSGFSQMEMLESLVLVADEWTPESGLMTAAQKIQRKAIAEKYKDEIKAVYPY